MGKKRAPGKLPRSTILVVERKFARGLKGSKIRKNRLSALSDNLRDTNSATSEDDTDRGTPGEATESTVSVEPELTAVGMFNTEQVEAVAARVSDRFHRNQKPLTFRLILVLQTQLRTDLVWTEIVTELYDSRTDGTVGCAILETEFGYSGHAEIESDWNWTCRESRLT